MPVATSTLPLAPATTAPATTAPATTAPATTASATTAPAANPPAASAPASTVTVSGQVPLHYDLSDPKSAPTDVTLEFTVDSGTTWYYCAPGPGGDGTSKLSTSPAGVAHTFVWDTVSDLGATLAPSVVIAVVPTGQPATLSLPFAVDDTGAAQPPSAPASSPATGVRDWTKAPAIVVVAATTELLAVGDVHGDYQTLASLMAAAKVIAAVPAQPGAVQWNAGQATLVCTGDLIDKYTDSLDVIAFFRALEASAAAAGGQVIVLMGNHEAEFLAGGGTSTKAADFETELKKAGISPTDVAAGNDALGIGAWLRALPFAAAVGDWFFCHAGNTAGMTLDQLRQAITTDVDANGFSANALVGATSLLEARLHPAPWWEGLATASGGTTQAAADEAELQSYVTALGAKHLVIGHQPVAVSFSDGSKRAADTMFAHFSGLIFLIDTGMSRGVDSGLGGVLQVAGVGTATPTATALFADGTSQVLLH
jgi:hypothetical protein